ncbi:MAG TPA: hypothetical protein PKD53_24875 [Chloroflexaceae bacterium]|nr:hypothetical protein [Chloroflexaceae bacterium]
MRKLRSLALLALLAFLTIAAAPRAEAQAATRCFPETGHCIGGPILRYWERRGGLPVFGYPITEQRVETVEGRTIPVQWFERDRLEIQQDGTITAGRLGARLLELQGRRWELTPRSEPVPPEVEGCAYFVETGRVLCDPFLSYWRANGGLERFGYPLTEVRLEQIEGMTYSVQYFERRRIEHHPELAGTPYEYLYGLLGRELLEVANLAPCQGPPRDVQFGLEPRLSDVGFRPELICPAASYAEVPASSQLFEGGTMIWVDLGAAGRWIYVYSWPRTPGGGDAWAVYPDTYQEGDPPIVATPPEVPARSPIKPQVPQRGFGKVWAAGERERLGWALEREVPDRASVQLFAVGGPAIRLNHSGKVWVFGPQPDQAQWLQ